MGDPEDPLVLADALARERRHGEALDILSGLAATRPDDWRVAVRAAYSLTALGRYAQALVQADRAVALRAYGVGLGSSRRWAEAEQVWRSVLLRDPGDRQALAGLVDALSGQGRRQDARMLAEGLHADAGPEAVARSYRGDATWLAVAVALVVVVVLPAFWGSVATAGTVMLAILALGYGLLRRGWARAVPVTAEAREAVARLDRSRDRAVAALGGVLALVTGVGWLTWPGDSMAPVVAGTVLLIGGVVALGVAVHQVRNRS